MKKNILLTLTGVLACALLLAPLAAAAPAEPMGKLVVILHTDDGGAADAALRIAGVAAQRGHQVTLLLRMSALNLALKDTSITVGGVASQAKLAAFMKAGSRVFVGGGCMKLQGIAKGRLIPGVIVGTPDTVMGMIFAENTRIICQ